MNTRFHTGVILAMLLLSVGCATAPTPASKSSKPERNMNATSLTVNPDSKGRQVLEAIPPESIMERFDTVDAEGRQVSYVAFTDTDTGALVFVDDKLHGSLSRHDAQAYYICRGHTLVNPERFWSGDAADWVGSLLDRATRLNGSVELEFSGKSTSQSIKEVAENPVFSKLKSFFGMGTNPLGVFNTLNTARSDFEASEQFDKESKGLALLKPGMSEMSLADVARPQVVAFASDGMILSYPTHRAEYFVAGGAIKVVQQPSFYYLFRTNSALFYAPGAQWSLCTAKRWMEAVPEAELKGDDGKKKEPAPAAVGVPK